MRWTLALGAAFLAAGCSHPNLPGFAVSCSCSCNSCDPDPPLVTRCTGLETGIAVTACVEQGKAGSPTDIQAACDKACGDAAGREILCFPPTCIPFLSHIQSCRTAGGGSVNEAQHCQTDSPSTVGIVAPDATVAVIDSARSQAILVHGDDQGSFIPTGTIVLGGGFCPDQSCPASIESVLVKSQSGFDVGSNHIDELDVVSNGTSDVIIENGTLAAVSSVPFAATVTMGDDAHSTLAAPDFLGGELNNQTRELTLTGQVATPDGSSTFTVVAVLQDSPPVAVIDVPSTAECGVPVTLSAERSFDPDGLGIAEVKWSEVTSTTNTPLGTGTTLQHSFSKGEHLVAAFIRNAHGFTAGMVKMEVSDTQPPVIDSVTASPDCLWPPNHDLVRYDLGSTFTVTAHDACDGTALQPTIAAVISSQPDDGRGDGKTFGDVRYSDQAFCIRQERTGTGSDGRTYEVEVQVIDSAGNVAQTNAAIHVPHDQRDHCVAADPGQVASSDQDAMCIFADGGVVSAFAGGASAGSDALGTKTASGCSSGGKELALLPLLALVLLRGRRRSLPMALATACVMQLGCSPGTPSSGSSGSGGSTGQSFPACATGWWASTPAPCSLASQCSSSGGGLAGACAATDCESIAFTGYSNVGAGDGGASTSGAYAHGHAIWSSHARVFAADTVVEGAWTGEPPGTMQVNLGGVSQNVSVTCNGASIQNGGATLTSLADPTLDAALDQRARLGSWSDAGY